MEILRCDDCCNVLDGIADGKVFECEEDVYEKTSFEHLCIECLEQYDDLYLDKKDYINLIRFNLTKSKNKKEEEK